MATIGHDAVAGQGASTLESGQPPPPAPTDAGPLRVSHVAGTNRRYPGERVIFYSRVDTTCTLPHLAVEVTLGGGLALETYQAAPVGDEVPRVVSGRDEAGRGEGTSTRLLWDVAGPLPPGSYEYQVSARVASTARDVVLRSQAVATSTGEDGSTMSARETAAVSVSAKGSYLEHLPALYYRDELMGRFLMLFESFWKPLEGQIDNLPFYFDPRMTPPDLLPWLASWLNLVLDERWPEEKQRQLLCSAAYLYRMRGTRQALEEYLEIYAGVKPEIVEHRAHNFRVGPDARLGRGTALGRDNVPQTFTVILRLPPVSLAAGEEERARLELERRRLIASIIDAEKPAHTRYTLHIETVAPEGQAVEAER